MPVPEPQKAYHCSLENAPAAMSLYEVEYWNRDLLPPETEIHAVRHKDKTNVTIKAGYNKVYGMGEQHLEALGSCQ